MANQNDDPIVDLAIIRFMELLLNISNQHSIM